MSLKWFHRWSWRHPLRYNRRNHRKLLIVDDQVAYVGGFNIHRQSSRRLYGDARWAAQAFYDVLMVAGLRIYEYQPRMLHAKTVVIDGNWAAVGTANLDYRSFFLNYELVLASGEPGFCSQLEQHFLNDLTESLPITPVNWGRRRWPGRILEAFGWIMRRWL